MKDLGLIKSGQILITSLVGATEQKPRVDITIVNQDTRLQLSADEAVDVAKNIIECAEGAYADAFIVNWICDKIFKNRNEANFIKAVQILQDFREYREKLAIEFKNQQK